MSMTAFEILLKQLRLIGTSGFLALVVSMFTPAYAESSSAESDSQALVHGALSSMHFWTKEHFVLHEETGIGLYYGSNSLYALMHENTKREHLDRKKRSGTFPEEPTAISCISWVYKHLKNGYERAGKLQRWNEIEKSVRSKNSDGSFLLQELVRDGWHSIYWSFDTKNPAADPQHHQYFYQQLQKTGSYMGIPIRSRMIDFRLTSGQQVPSSEYEALEKVPFWVGIANGAYHVFLGYGHRISEAHSTYNPDLRKNVEDRSFSEWGLDTPVKYLSGVIVVPPGTWSLK